MNPASAAAVAGIGVVLSETRNPDSSGKMRDRQ